jgi:hypothetical protein
MTVRPNDIPTRPWALALLWAGAATTVAVLVDRFWIPLDDGTLAQSAERVLGGELPHRDFGDPYSGLNAFLGAWAFRIFGVSLASLRIPLVVGFALWVPAVWSVVRRFAAGWTAVAATTLTLALSVLAYPAAMPTWFGLFAVTWGLVALLAHIDTGRRRWLLVVGVAAGVAVLFKVVGLYFLAVALLTVAWTRADGSWAYRALSVLGVGLFLLLLGRLVLPRTGPSGVYHFFLPALALGMGIVGGGWRATEGPARGVPAVLRDCAVLFAGTLTPILIFLVPYVMTGSAGAWVEGVFLLPGRRFGAASSVPGSLWTVSTGVAAVAVMFGGTRLTGVRARRAAITLGAVITAGVALDDFFDGGVFTLFWYSARTWIPALTVLATWRWITAPQPTPEAGRQTAAHIAIVSTAALWALVLFPYSSPAYFFYVAPLGVLATLAVLRGEGRGIGPVTGVLAALYAFLGAGYTAGVVTSGTTLLDMERGGISVAEHEAVMYRELAEAIDEHSGGGGIWAGPDAPEVYFLSGRTNPTPILYEFLTPRFEGDGELERFLETRGIAMVAINTRPLFSPPLSDDVLHRLSLAFPEERTLAPYVLRWRSR